MIDSRELASAFSRRHHNVLAAIDLVLRQCPAAARHYRFENHLVTAGLDRTGFMLLAMSFPSTQRETALSWLIAYDDQI